MSASGTKRTDTQAYVRYKRAAYTWHYSHFLRIKPLSIWSYRSYLVIFKLQPADNIQFSEAKYCVGDFPNAFLNIVMKALTESYPRVPDTL